MISGGAAQNRLALIALNAYRIGSNIQALTQIGDFKVVLAIILCKSTIRKGRLMFLQIDKSRLRLILVVFSLV